jgi:hypothetical protein
MDAAAYLQLLAFFLKKLTFYAIPDQRESRGINVLYQEIDAQKLFKALSILIVRIKSLNLKTA